MSFFHLDLFSFGEEVIIRSAALILLGIAAYKLHGASRGGHCFGHGLNVRVPNTPLMEHAKRLP